MTTRIESPALDTMSLYRNIFDLAGDAIAIIEPDGRYREQNTAHRTLLGYSDEELHGRTPAVHLGDEVFASIADHLSLHGAYRGVVRSRTKTGETRTIDLSAFTLRGPDGRVQCHVGIKRDITDLEHRIAERTAELHAVNEELARHVVRQQRVEEELRRSEARWKTAQEIAHLGSWEWDLSSGAVTWSEELYRIFGLDPAAAGPMTYERFFHAVHPDDRTLVERAADAARRRREPIDMDYRIVRPDGSIRRLHSRAEVLGEDAGAMMIGTGQDVTEIREAEDAVHRLNEALESRVHERTAQLEATNRRLVQEVAERTVAEERLREAHQTLHTLIDTSPLGIVGLASDGRVQIWNRSAERLFGWSEREVLGHPIPSIPDEKQSEFSGHLRTVLSGRTFTGLETARRRKDGSPVDVSISVGPLRNAHGDIVGGVAFFTDITDRKRAERDLLRTSKLDSIGVLAGGIAHDFNNILTAIIGNISLARLSLDPDTKIATRLSEATKASLRAKHLTQQLLTFSKGSSPIKRTVALPDLLVEWVGFALRGSNLRPEFNLPSDLWPVEIDEGQISQVIYNLVINAQQAMPEGGLLDVHAANVVLDTVDGLPLAPGRYVRVAIIDTGVGIPAEHLTKIFDPFFTTKVKGSGLGLTTSYGIVTTHQGYITVESEPGQGTTFAVYLPASSRQVDDRDDQDTPPPPGRGRILFMDDEDAICEFIYELLSGLGYDVTCVPDGGKAIEQFRAAQERHRPFDVVVLDLTVPGGLGGRETLPALRRIDPGIVALVSSGYSNDAVMADFARFGFAGRMVKPYQVDEFAKTIESLVNRGRGGPSAHAHR